MYHILYRYVGLCATIKLVALAIFAIDWWLVRRRKQLEYTTPLAATAGSIISLDKCKRLQGNHFTHDYLLKTIFSSIRLISIHRKGDH